MHSRRSGKRFKPWILAEGGCLSFIVVIPTADSSAAGTGGTRPDAIEAAMQLRGHAASLGQGRRGPTCQPRLREQATAG